MYTLYSKVCTVKVPERIQFWHEDVHTTYIYFLANALLARKSKQCLLAECVYFHVKIVNVQEL